MTDENSKFITTDLTITEAQTLLRDAIEYIGVGAGYDELKSGNSAGVKQKLNEVFKNFNRETFQSINDCVLNSETIHRNLQHVQNSHRRFAVNKILLGENSKGFKSFVSVLPNSNLLVSYTRPNEYSTGFVYDVKNERIFSARLDIHDDGIKEYIATKKPDMANFMGCILTDPKSVDALLDNVFNLLN